MKPTDLEFFKDLLVKKMADLLGIAEETVIRMNKGDGTFPDPLDRAMTEATRSIELRKRDRERKLIQKIINALKKIEDGSYGICEVCREPITYDRLRARPETTMCFECKVEQEEIEKKYGS